MANGKLTPKQALFVLEYLKDLNGTAAAKRAGYSEKTAGAIAYEYLKKPQIAAAVQEQMDKRVKKAEISGDKVLTRLDEIGSVDISEAYDDNGRLKSIHDIPKHIRQAIASIETYEERDRDGELIGTVKKLKLWNKVQANELLGKHQKLWTDKVEAKVEHSGEVSVKKVDLTERLEQIKNKGKK